ncbi:hypothetical protein [Mycobacterium ostraviense]|uniref:Lipoprotein LpqJ n=1 Tax=Mycobacterium ostraviense TaxID=2738409 RepID=A0A163XND1_9MYCO|nr:hypothetical protein [Mycobacterium ostraviense]KZS59565.1 hypothetical protein A4G28_15965 [Mycobacterium ostraviense]UGT91020.1 hypothetical protein LTS72_22785 [Mycobacterium ostraviense]
MRLLQIGAALLAAGALGAGCDSTIDGRPIAGPGAGPIEPSFPTSRPSTSPPSGTAPLPPTTPASPTTPAGAIPLPPDQNGYVFIETKSGQTRCQINKDSVGCEAPFTNSPIKDGEHANGVHITAAGTVQWVLGNLGAIPTVTIDYKTYDAQGWTITSTAEGTRFQNNSTGHGMFVSIDRVSTF